jgi:hypothetical protein
MGATGMIGSPAYQKAQMVLRSLGEDVPQQGELREPLMNPPTVTAQIQFLTGKDYPDLCPACQSAIDQSVELVREGEDTNDQEAPLNFAGDHNMLCGGRTCKVKEQRETPLYCLRKRTAPKFPQTEEDDSPIFTLPSVATGTSKELHDFATKNGWLMVQDYTIFRRHYKDAAGNSYYLDLA